MARVDLDGFVACYKSGRLHDRVETSASDGFFAMPPDRARQGQPRHLLLKRTRIDDPDLLPLRRNRPEDRRETSKRRSNVQEVAISLQGA